MTTTRADDILADLRRGLYRAHDGRLREVIKLADFVVLGACRAFRRHIINGARQTASGRASEGCYEILRAEVDRRGLPLYWNSKDAFKAGETIPCSKAGCDKAALTVSNGFAACKAHQAIVMLMNRKRIARIDAAHRDAVSARLGITEAGTRQVKRGRKRVIKKVLP